MDPTYYKMTETLRSEGLVAALKVLNDRVSHRYTAVYRLDPDNSLALVAFVDKQCEVCPPYLLSVPYDVSFCQFTIKHGLFRTSDSTFDERLNGHPYQGVMKSYHAAPLVSTDGRVKGTICHFDLAALPLSDEDFELLRLAARVLPGAIGPQRPPASPSLT